VIVVTFLIVAAASAVFALALAGLVLAMSRLIRLAVKLGQRGGQATDLRPRVGHARRVFPEGTE
jgi:hypothetical protein